MARKLRLEFPGACYHVINRGNYRADLFKTEGAKAAFEGCLFEACAKSGWLLQAYVLMSNHYHLALETPQGNLVAGMQWLQATFANRFNKLRGERGHLFQGRYKSLLVEEGAALGQVCHYIHLNPVRAGLVPVEQLKAYRYCSYWYLWRKADRPRFLEMTTALVEAGELADERRGWQAYEKYLAWQAAEGPVGKSRAYVSLSRGWALGTQEFKAALVKDHALAATSRAWEASGAQEVRQMQWAAALARALKAVRRSPEEIVHSCKSAEWKLAIAAWLKTGTQASNRWLSENLHLGVPAALSRNLTHYRRARQSQDPTWERLISISAT
jgi:REP element-mobilizing transposase RayT